MRRGKKPTRKQKERLQRAGLPPDNWLIIREKPTGEMIILHRRTNKTRYVPAAAGQSNTPVKKEYIMNYMYIPESVKLKRKPFSISSFLCS